MNINYKTHPVLEPLNKLKNKNKTGISGKTQITQNSHREIVELDLNQFLDFLNFNNINYYNEKLFSKILSQKFDFFKNYSKFFNDCDLSDNGVIILNEFSCVYFVEKTSNKYNFHFYEIFGKNDLLHISGYSWGNIKIENWKYQCILTQSIEIAEFTDNNYNWDLEFDKSIHKVFAIIFNHIIFKKFAPIETKQFFVSGKTRKKNYKPNKNQLGLKINYITSQWFTNLERSGAFGVKGHWRLQPCGIGMKDRKLIWIKDFVKEGYTRKAQRIIEEEKNTI